MSATISPAPATTPSSRRGIPLVWTEERLAPLRPQVRAWMRETTAARFAFGLRDLAAEFQISDDVGRRFITECEEEGLVTYRGATHLGWSWNGAAGRSVTLADLLVLAETKVDPTATAEKGRRGLTVERLTPSQLKDIRTVANLVARSVPGAAGNPAKVTGVWFGYDLTARAWELEAHVARWSDEQHRANHDRKAGAGIWNPRLNTGRSKHLGAIANLMDLAATHETIPRAARPEHGVRSAATEWRRIIRRWTARILAHDPVASPALIANGCRALSVAATRRRELSFRTTDWLALRAELEERFDRLKADPEASAQEVRYAGQQRDAARYVWRRAVEILRGSLGRPSGRSGRVRLQMGDEYHWATAQDMRRSLVPDGAIIRAAAHATGKSLSKKQRRAAGVQGAPSATLGYDYSGTWTTLGSAYARSFVEGEQGVAAWVTWSTAPVDWLERNGYPQRAFIDPTPQMLQGIRRAMGAEKTPYLLSYETLVGRLRLLSQLAGWAHENGDIVEEMVGRRFDFVHGDNLASLCSMQLVLAYSEWMREDSDEEEDEVTGVVPAVAEMAKHIAKVASPFLEGRALKRAEALEKAGDRAAADDARAEAARFREEGFKLKAWGYANGRRENTRKDIVEIAEGWAGSNHRSGWLKLDDLVDLVLRVAEQEVGLTLEQQIQALRSAETATPRQRAELLAWQTHAWATLMRSAMLVNLVRKVPLRARALSELRLDWWEATVDGQRVEPWSRDASVMLRVPGRAMKTKTRDYVAPYIRPECVGVADFEAGARRDLLEAYLRPHGARAFLLTTWETQDVDGADGRVKAMRVALATIESPYVLPASATYGNGGRGEARQTRLQTGLRWTPSGLSVFFEQTVRLHARELQINLAALAHHQGAFRIHVARLLYGTHWAPKNLPDASLMLHHSDIAITSRLYVGRSSAHSTLEASASERGGRRDGQGESEVVCLLREQAMAAEARAAAADGRANMMAAQLAELTAVIARLTHTSEPVTGDPPSLAA